MTRTTVALVISLALLAACSPPPEPMSWGDAPVPAAEVQEYAARLNLDSPRVQALAAAAPADVPPPLVVASWARYYELPVAPFGTYLTQWDWAYPTTGAPVDSWIVYYRVHTRRKPFPMAVPAGDTATVWIQVAGQDSTSREGPFSLPGRW